MLIVNWNTTRVFWIKFPWLLNEKFPFSETAGLNDDKMEAGRA